MNSSGLRPTCRYVVNVWLVFLFKSYTSTSRTVPSCSPILTIQCRDWAKASDILLELGVLYTDVSVDDGADLLSKVDDSLFVLSSAERSQACFLSKGLSFPTRIDDGNDFGI